uniref:Uncharacterized protein n=1 Tax=Arundo donax TaxID=35708 RepID=A0A0A9EM88_ARUDO
MIHFCMSFMSGLLGALS